MYNVYLQCAMSIYNVLSTWFLAHELQLSPHCVPPHSPRASVSLSPADLEQWITLVRREKAVYHTLNKMSVDTSRKVCVRLCACVCVCVLGRGGA